MGRLIGRGGTRVFDETEKPDFLFQVPALSSKNLFFLFCMLDFHLENRFYPVIWSIQKMVS